jgi:hypothetical protein
MQSEPVSPPPITTTCLRAAEIGGLKIQYQQIIVAMRSSVSSTSNAASSKPSPLNVAKLSVRPRMFSMQVRYRSRRLSCR